MRTVAKIVFLAAIAISAHAQTFVWADREGIPIAKKFTFAAGNLHCVIRQNGSGQCRRAGAKLWRFRIHVDDHGELEQLSAAILDDDLLLVLSATDEEIDWGQLIRIHHGKTRPQWNFHFSTLNVATPVVSDGSVFVAGSGFIGRVNLRSGLPEWRIERGSSGASSSPVLSIAGDQLVIRWGDKTECLVAKTGECGSYSQK